MEENRVREAVLEILKIEDEAHRIVAAAEERAKEIRAEGEAASAARREAILSEVKRKADSLRSAAEAQAQQEREQILASARIETERLRRVAEGRIEMAVQLVVNEITGISSNTPG